MQLSVLCTDKKLEENFWYAFEKNLYHFKNNSKENRASIERFSKIQNFFFFYYSFPLLTGSGSNLMVMIHRMRRQG